MMKGYSIPGEMRIQAVNYAVMEFEHFEVREVLYGRKPKGEYHIKIKDTSNPVNAMNFFAKRFDGCEVGLVDPSGILSLEYPVYIKTNSEVIIETIKDILESIDEGLSGESRKES